VATLALASAAPASAQLPLHVGGTAADLANATHYDDQGNAYLVGAFRGTADFDPSAGSFTFTSLGLTDGFVAMYGPAGNLLCAGPIRGPGNETVNDVKFRNGLIYVTGYYSAGADFGGGFFPGNLGGLDGYVAAYSCASGTMLPTWVSTINGPGTQVGEDLDVPVLSPANVWATGYFQNATSFATGFTLASAGGTDIFVAGYDPFFGGLFDAFRIGGPQNDAGLGISLTRPEAPCITGYFRTFVDFDPSSGVFNLVSAGNDDGFAACYLDPVPGSPTLFAPFNAFPIGGPGIDRGTDIDTGFAGGGLVVNLTGGFSATAGFNGPSFTSNGNLDAFVASYDFNANNLWVVPFGGPQLDAGFGIDGDECGNVVATGAFRAGPVNFDPFWSGFLLPTFANADAWVAGYDFAGTFRFANRVARNANDLGYGVAVKPSGAHLAAGEFGGVPIFSSGTNTAGSTYFPTYGNQDGYLSAYNINGAIQRASCAVAPAGLEVWTDFDAFSGGQFLDLASPPTTANNGTPVGGAGQIAGGPSGQAGNFPNPGAHVVIPPDPSLAPGFNDLTVDASVRWNTGPFMNHLSIVSNLDTPAAANGYEVLLRRVTNATWAITVVLNDGAGAPASLTSPPFPFPPNTWRFVAVTVDHSVQANFYVDGVFIGAATAPPEGNISWPGPMYYHRSILNSGNDRPGRLDEVEIFHALLTPAEIAQLYAAGKCKPCWSAPFQPTQRTAEADTDADAEAAPSVEATVEAPMVFALGQSAPNPTTGLTEITFTLPAAYDVRLAVYDVLGREVAVVVAERREAGRHVARFDADALPSGIYVYRLDAGGQTATRRMTVTR
jgi:hypothetical protein